VKTPSEPGRAAVLRITAACAVALAFSLGVYLLLEAVQPDGGLVGFSFLLVLPAAISGFVAYVADPWKTRSHRQYLQVPLLILVAVTLLSLVVLREGVICVLILAPLWLASGLAGAELTWRLRRRSGEGRTYSLAMLALPLVAMQVEPHVPLPREQASVARSVIVQAPVAAIWPLLRGVPDVRPDEGRWNLSQDVIGIPRPLGARLMRDGLGADRQARWAHGIRFRERITAWQLHRQIGWRFLWDDIAGWGYTDRHLMPDSPYFHITSGGYRADPLPGGRTRITLHTDYWVQTPVNGYSRLWGELLLGDVESNILAIIKGRAERGRAP
jgi:hypothetical protein